MKASRLRGSICIAAALVVGCRADERCKAIQLQEISASLHVWSEQRFSDELRDSVPLFATEEQREAIKRRMRARRQQELNRTLRQENPQFAARGFFQDDPLTDSLDPPSKPPPRPSDARWYEEHCWEGRAR